MLSRFPNRWVVLVVGMWLLAYESRNPLLSWALVAMVDPPIIRALRWWARQCPRMGRVRSLFLVVRWVLLCPWVTVVSLVLT